MPTGGGFLTAINAPDLGLKIAGKHFAVTQEMTEEFRQDVSYGRGFGVDGPITRSVMFADEGTLTFTAVVLKDGDGADVLSNEEFLKTIRDFTVVTTKGDLIKTYTNCNWTALTVRSTLEQVTIEATVSIPGLSSG